jgi:D-alanyl-D-alanine carboxypeptidase
MGTQFRPLVVVLVAALAALAWTTQADAAKPKRHPAPHIARSYSSIVIDAATGAVLQEDNADAQKYPASLTKMMTLYMIFEALDAGKLTLGTRLPVSSHSASQSPTKLGLEAGEQVAVRDVILGLVTKSANDAAATAAEALGGTEEHFGELMTQRARRLGMANTTFRNASGLPDPGQTTTARDLARLSRALIYDFPHHYRYFSTPEFVYAGRRHPNHNRLMTWYDGADGIKTGFINAAGFNLAASAVRDNKRLIGVVLGGPSPVARDQYMGKLLDAGFARVNGSPEIREATAPRAKTAKPAVVAEAKPARQKKKRIETPAAGMTVVAAPSEEKRAGKQEADHGWAIQVGAFNRVDAARRAAESAAKLTAPVVGNAGIEISPQGKRHSMHRARLVGLTAMQAREACQILTRKERDCMMLSPSGSYVRVATTDAGQTAH